MFVYSCPYQYAEKKTVDLRITESTMEIYYKGERLTTHNLFPEYVNNRYSTHEEDMPPEFRKIKPWDDERIRNWAARIGPNTLKVRQRTDPVFLLSLQTDEGKRRTMLEPAGTCPG
ncbi:MAG: hypothetical protein IJK06_06570 [Clostridia bacterium]|nr:hypothetical protein [Clostridia bacterium]